MSRAAAGTWRLQVVGAEAHGRAFAHACHGAHTAHGTHACHAAHDDPCGLVKVEAAALRQDRHHGVGGDGAEFIGESAVVDEDDDGEDPLADGGRVLQDKALVDKENTA